MAGTRSEYVYVNRAGGATSEGANTMHMREC